MKGPIVGPGKCPAKSCLSTNGSFQRPSYWSGHRPSKCIGPRPNVGTIVRPRNGPGQSPPGALPMAQELPRSRTTIVTVQWPKLFRRCGSNQPKLDWAMKGAVKVDSDLNLVKGCEQIVFVEVIR